MIGGGTAEVGARTDAETGTGTDMEISGGTSIGGSNIVAERTRVTAGRLAGWEKESGAGRLLIGWDTGAFTIVGADVSPLSGIKIGWAHELGSTAGPYPRNGLQKMVALLNMPGVGPKMQVAEDESGKLPNVLVTRLQRTCVVVAHA
ncbi:hypothetical protein CRG98_000227 [Punica granatum]|uniref:Uncharacterized protein n=1 Tax=Punica granatum TaxID=22663 RepID=A0A2I0LFD0_PUNGR|nr:hypothetical protein CRG98_000227 [Punica granatum]